MDYLGSGGGCKVKFSLLQHFGDLGGVLGELATRKG
jgi:hypothetical protein